MICWGKAAGIYKMLFRHAGKPATIVRRNVSDWATAQLSSKQGIVEQQKTMELRISYCGLICHTCPIYLATRDIDQAKRRKMQADIAEQCNKLYGTKYGPEDINGCDGCWTETGRLFSGCKTCSIRSCAKNKGLDNCACCSEYACEQLLKFFDTEPVAKERLDQIKSRPQSYSD